ncbi:sodium- and chloride-dependent transporter XTRP3 isoform X2 [Phocoena sinus]|uniref:sodium- and chloride-dependent transporter XTRP3 isoform X2 n=1 Tax=Phocoena sinus TaxID=42100 RepID=UPI0013C40F2D|nr:sodium- and chloride-dependent transporter XTRP3 isoform X2 [Phocoena sinus]
MDEARPLWATPLQFVFACISYAVGLGNVWRFPYLCQMYGGGVASVVVSFFLSMYYNVINAWAFWYLFHSFQDPLPWSMCPLNGNRTGYDEECEKASSTQYFWYRKTLNISPSIQESGAVQWEPALCLILAWLLVYLCILRGTESTGKVVYFTALLPYCVLIIYLVRGLTLHGATNGLAYMFTPKMEQLANPKAWINAATQIFFSLGLGFGSLIAFASYNEPSNNCQKHAVIVSIINSSTSIFASVVTFSIYGFKATFNYESCLNKVILLLTNSFDLEDGFLTVSNLEEVKSYLASAYPSKYSEVFPQIKNCSLESELETAVQGTGLAFIVYTEAIKNMEVSQLWSVLYFFMLLMLGIGSMLGNTAAILTPLTDSKVISSYLPKEAISGLVCLVSCAIGLVFTVEAGNYWFDIFNDYAATLPLLLIVLVEAAAVCYLYGLRRFESDLKAMTGHALNWYWKAMWGGVSPLLIISLFVFYLSDYIITGTLQYQAWDASQVCKNTEPRSWAVSFSTWAAVKRVRFHPELPGGLCPLRPLRQGQARLEGMAPEELGGAGTGVYTGVARTEPGTERGTQEAGLHLLTQQRAAHQCFNNLDSRITAPGLRVSLGCPCTDTLS